MYRDTESLRINSQFYQKPSAFSWPWHKLKIKSLFPLRWEPVPDFRGQLTKDSLEDFLVPKDIGDIGFLTFFGPAVLSYKLMKTDTPEPLYYTDSLKNGFYNLKDSPIIINLFVH